MTLDEILSYGSHTGLRHEVLMVKEAGQQWDAWAYRRKLCLKSRKGSLAREEFEFPSESKVSSASFNPSPGLG